MNTRKILALLLAMVMVLGLCSMASAVAPNEKVQINNMMVDASLVEAQAEETTVMYAAEDLTATTANTVSYPPIQKISVDWTNSTVTADDTATTATYNMALYGATSSNLRNRKLTFVFSTNSAISSNISVALGTKTVSGAAGSTKTMSSVTLAATQTFTVTWTETKNGVATNKSVTCTLNVTTPAAASVNLTSVEIAGTAATYSDTTVGGVTRYNYAATLPSGTATTALDAATVVVTPVSTSATMTLKNADGTTAAVGSKSNGVYTFSDVNFNAGAKTLTVTDGSTSRDYQVSASVEGQTVSVYIAIRTYTVFDWLNGTTGEDEYDYATNGYGSGADVSETEYNRISDIATALQVYNTRTNTSNAPISSTSNNRKIFNQNSYCELTIDAGSSVMDALLQFLNQEGLYQTGAENNYVSSMGNGTATSAQIGEFDCGFASGWMYTARTSPEDVTSSLPNAGANNWPISNGMYIDWYYTAAYGADFGYSMFDM